MRKYKLFCAVLILSLLFCSCNSDQPSQQQTEAAEQSTNSPNEITLVRNGVPVFDIVYAKDSGYSNISVWVKQVQSALKLRTNVEFKTYDDSKTARSESLILIGDTSVTASALAISGLGAGGYSVSQKSNHIIINGKDDMAMVKAVNWFCNTLLPKVQLSDDGKTATLPFEESKNEGEPLPELTIAGTPISAYTVVYPARDAVSEEAARNLRSLLNKKYGVSLPIVSDDATEKSCEILIGATKRSESQNHLTEAELKPMEYEYRVIKQKLSVIAYDGAGYGLAPACRLFLEKAANQNITDLKENYMLKTRIQLTADSHTDLATGADVRVMTGNVLSEEWGGTEVEPRSEIFYANLQCYQPHVMGLQEVSKKWTSALKEILADSDYKLLHDVVEGTDSNYCPIIYNFATVEVVESGAYRLSIGGPAKARTVTWGVFRDKASNQRFAVINTHLDWTETPDDFVSQGAATPYAREQQVREIAETFSALQAKYSDADILLTADWNTFKDAHPLNILTELTGVKFAEDVVTNHNWGNEVDHILVQPTTNVISLYLYTHNAMDMGLTDHPWGFADIALRS